MNAGRPGMVQSAKDLVATRYRWSHKPPEGRLNGEQRRISVRGAGQRTSITYLKLSHVRGCFNFHLQVVLSPSLDDVHAVFGQPQCSTHGSITDFIPS